MRYTFCTIDNGAGTAWLRAGMIVAYMNAENKRQARWIFGQQNIQQSLESADSNDCYIFIKKYHDLETIEKAKKKCGVVVLDMSDDFGEKNREIWLNIADCVLYDTDSFGKLLQEQGYKNTLKIDHLHSNFTKDFSQIRKNIPELKVAGYLGTPQQLHDTDRIIDIVKRENLQWFQVEPNPISNARHTMALDLQIVKISHFEKMKYKPFNKLMNVYSFGISCLYSPYESYLELVKNSEKLSWMSCDTLDDFEQKLARIKKDKNLLQEVQDEAFNLSRKYHVSQYESCYKSLFNFVEFK